MEHFASQGCCRLGQTAFSMEMNNFSEVTAMKTKMQDAFITINFPGGAVIFFRNITFQERHFIRLS